VTCGSVGSIITRVWADVDAAVTASTGWPGSGSRRSRTRRATSTCWSWSITTHAGWCGPLRDAPVPRCASSSTCSVGAVRPDHPRQRGWRRLHRHRRGPDLTGPGAGSGPVPRREVGQRGPGGGPPRGVQRRPETVPDRAETRPRTSPSGCAPAARQRASGGPEGRPLLVVEEPGGAPRGAITQAG